MAEIISHSTDRAALSGPVAAASFVAGVAGATALSDAPYPRPGSTPEQIKRYFSDNAGPARISIVGQLVSAAALGAFAASVVRLGGRADTGTRGIQTAAVAGGVLSVATLTVSALTSLRLTQGEADDAASALRLHHRVFVAGGPLHGPGIGLLMAALGTAGLRTKLLPRSLSMMAIGTAIAGALAPVALKLKPAVWLIPASRFPGLLISGIAGAMLMRSARA
jgi:hypothetical protein